MAVRRGGNPRISIQADADGVGHATRQAEGHLNRLEKSGSKSLHGLKTAAVGVGTALTTGIVVGTAAAAKAAIESEKANARLKAQLDALGISYNDHEKQIQRVIDKHSQLSGFDDEDLGDSFTNIVRVVGNVNEALDLNVLAMDFARAKHIEVAKAGEIVGKVAGGNTGILKRYGVQIDDNATKSEALAEFQKKFAGQAEAYGKSTAGSADRAKVAFENLGESLGSKVTPLIAKGAEALTDFIRQMTLGEGPGGRVRTVIEGVGTAAADAARGVGNLVRGFQDGEPKARLLAAAITGVIAGFSAFKVGGAVIAGIDATKKAWAAFAGPQGAIAKSPFGVLAVALSGLIGALGILSLKTRDNEVSSRAFNDALNAQRDAMREVAGIELDEAQRRANLKSATVAVEQAEKNLGKARKEHGKHSLEARQAEADLRQARLSQKRASVDLANAEEDAKEKRRRLKDATHDLKDEEKKHNKTIDDAIDKRKKEVSGIDDAIGRLKREAVQNDATRASVKKLRDRQRDLNDEINALKSKKVDVSVKFKLSPSPGSVFGTGGVGDGVGMRGAVHASVTNLAQNAADTGRLLPVAPASLMGADPDLAPFAAIAAGMGLQTTSGIRPGAITSSGNVSFHSSGDAIDESGSPGAMMNFFRTMRGTFGPSLRELIYTPGGVGIKDGRPFRYSGQVAQDHYDHVHVAYTGPFGDGLGRRQGDGIGEAVRAARQAGFRGQDLVTAVAIAGPESGFHNHRRLRTSREDSRGMMQINTLAHPWASSMNLYDAFVNFRAARRVWREAGRSFRPWTGFTSGGYRAYEARVRRALAASPKAKKPKPKGTGFELGESSGIEFTIPPPEGFEDLGPPPGTGGDAGGSSGGSDQTAQLAAIMAEVAANQRKLIFLQETQAPSMVGLVLQAVNNGIGAPLGLHLQGTRSPVGSVAGF